MTRKEAIKILSDYESLSCGFCHCGGDEVPQAFEMAVKALEETEIKPPCGVKELLAEESRRKMRTIDADEALKRISEKCEKSKNLDVINGLCGATAIIYDLLIETGQERVKE